MGNITDIFASPEEKFVAVLGNDAAQSFFASGSVGNGFMILSDRRVYFRGKCLRRVGKRFSYLREERTVDVSNVSGTGFVYSNPVWLLALAIFFTVYTLVCLIPAFSSIGHGDAEVIAFAIVAASALVTAVLYFLYHAKKKTVFEVSFAGGGIGLNVQWLAAGEADHFQKNIKLVGDALKREERMYGLGSSPAVELEKFGKLLEAGLITPEEFAAQKQRLLSGSLSANTSPASQSAPPPTYAPAYTPPVQPTPPSPPDSGSFGGFGAAPTEL